MKFVSSFLGIKLMSYAKYYGIIIESLGINFTGKPHRVAQKIRSVSCMRVVKQ